MAHTFRTEGSGAQQTLHEIEDEKIPVYDTQSDAEADLANLAEGQIVATKDAGTDEQTLIEYVDGRLETTEVNVSVSISGLTCKARKSGNTVTVIFIPAGSDVTIPYAATATIGTLPEGYRPVRTEEFTIGARVVSSTDDVAVYPPRVRFDADGTIAIRDWNPTANVTLNSPFNTFTFLVDGTNSHGMTVNTLKDAKDYTDARAVRKYDYTMTGTTDVITDIQSLCNQLVTMGVNTYAGSFLRSGKTHGHYNITVSQAGAIATLNGTVVIDNEQNNANSYTVSRVNNDWLIRSNVIHKDIVVPTPSTNPGNVYSCVLYQLQNADWTFLTSQPAGATATGNFELSGYYWGNYVATNHIDYTRTVTGTIDWNAVSHTFSAFYDSSTSTWKINIDGEWLLYNANGLILTVTGQSRTFRFICDRVPFNVVGEQLQTYNLYGRQALGRVGMEMNVALTYLDTDLIALANNSYAWPAGSIYWWSNPTFQRANTSASTWPMYAQNDNHFYKIELWGSAWDQCYVSGGFEFTL